MAKQDGDIVDFLMGTIFQFFGWILKILFKLTIGLVILIVKGIINGIKSLTAKKNNPTSGSIEQ